MSIRTYQAGDEHAQVQIYNLVASSLPAFKPATIDEISRRNLAADADPTARFYATVDGEVVGYAVFNPNGRVSYPWCLPGAHAFREPLLERILDEMRLRRLPEAWAAYRADWTEILEFFQGQSFDKKRVVINYVTGLAQLPSPQELPSNRTIEPLKRDDLSRLPALAPPLFSGMEIAALRSFYWNNEIYNFPDSLFALKEKSTGELRAVYVLVTQDCFADPTKIDSAMPCFRLGAFGTEGQRHKRVNGLFSCAFVEEAEGELVLSSTALSRAIPPGLTHLAAQAPSDDSALCDFYDRFFRRQGTFPILARRLAS
jgi:hypothetical protein